MDKSREVLKQEWLDKFGPELTRELGQQIDFDLLRSPITRHGSLERFLDKLRFVWKYRSPHTWKFVYGGPKGGWWPLVLLKQLFEAPYERELRIYPPNVERMYRGGSHRKSSWIAEQKWRKRYDEFRAKHQKTSV